MTFIPYTPAEKETANSYITVQELDDFATIDYSIEKTVIDNMNEEQKQIALINATKIIDTYWQYRGSKYDSKQNLEFPRDFEEEQINYNVKQATAQIAYQLQVNKDVFYSQSSTEQEVKKKKVDTLEVEYYESGKASNFNNKISLFTVNLLERYFLGGNVVSLSRG
jgi:hypothetical protein